MIRTGIFGGSFNPIHKGHTALVQALCSQGLVEEVWLMVSPQNPLKRNLQLLDEQKRLQLAQLATENIPEIQVCDLEFQLPRPSYTYLTLRELRNRYPQREFVLIIGADNWACFSQWRETSEILQHHSVLVYPRPKYPLPSATERSTVCDGKLSVSFVEAPLFPVSSTQIRELLAKGLDASNYLHPAVAARIQQEHLYSFLTPQE